MIIAFSSIVYLDGSKPNGGDVSWLADRPGRLYKPRGEVRLDVE